MTRSFTDRDVPDQNGKTFFITGANTGLGFEAAAVLAARGARVLLGCRSPEKADDAKARILARTPDADVDIVHIDLGDLDSVRAAAETVSSEPRLDVLINNAGLMMPPLQRTQQGFESQLGVNHLGAFALTGLLLDKLAATPGARNVNTSSNGHKMAKLDFDDLNAEKSYSALGQYGLSKLANLLHTYELDRRVRAKGIDLVSVAAHPGAAVTELGRYAPQVAQKIVTPLLRPVFNTAAQGAWPTLMAATAPDVEGGEYFGPSRMALSGPAKRAKSNAKSHDRALAKKMWDVSVQLTGVDPGV